MTPVFCLAGLVFLVSYWVVAYLFSPTSRLYVLDHPNQRSLHAHPIPRTGGVAILGSVCLGLVLGQVIAWLGVDFWNEGQWEGAGTLWLGIGAALFIGFVSFWDDRVGLPRTVRIGTHILVAIGFVWGGGSGIEMLKIPSFSPIALGSLVVPTSIIFLVWMTNLYNFMDGMDGFSGGMTLIGYSLFAGFGWWNGYQEIFVVSLYVVAATAAFLRWNFPPARIFMGDSGSTALGFLSGVMILIGVHEELFDVWVPLLIFSPFIVDATTTLLKRLVRGERIWQPHREHYYQRLVLAGLGHQKTVLYEYGLMLLCGISAVIYHSLGEGQQLLLLLSWVILYCMLAFGVQFVERQCSFTSVLDRLTAKIWGKNTKFFP